MEIDAEDDEANVKNFATMLPNAAGWRASLRNEIGMY